MIRALVDFALRNRWLILGGVFVLSIWGIISFRNLPGGSLSRCSQQLRSGPTLRISVDRCVFASRMLAVFMFPEQGNIASAR